MATGRDDFLWRSVVQFGGLSLALKVLLFLASTSWRGWETLSTMVCNLDSILLSDTTHQGVQLHPHSVTGLAVQFVESVAVRNPQSAAPAHNSKQESSGHHSLIKHPQHSPADVEGPQSPLVLLVEGISVFSPVQLMVYEHSQVFTLLHNVHADPLDGNRGNRCPDPPQIHNQLLCLCCVELQVVLLTPCDKVTHHSAVFIILTLADTSNYCRFIRKLLEMAGLCLVAEVRSVEGEEEGKEDLLGP